MNGKIATDNRFALSVAIFILGFLFSYKAIFALINNLFRTILLITISFLLLKNLAMVILLGDFSSLIPAFIHVLLIYLIAVNHAHTSIVIFFWALFYLFLMTGIKAGGKTLVILGGNGWEIDKLRYGIDLFLVFLGLVVLVLRKRMVKSPLKE